MRQHWRDGFEVWFGRHLAGLARLGLVVWLVGLLVKGVHG